MLLEWCACCTFGVARHLCLQQFPHPRVCSPRHNDIFLQMTRLLSVFFLPGLPHAACVSRPTLPVRLFFLVLPPHPVPPLLLFAPSSLRRFTLPCFCRGLAGAAMWERTRPIVTAAHETPRRRAALVREAASSTGTRTRAARSGEGQGYPDQLDHRGVDLPQGSPTNIDSAGIVPR